MSYATWTKDDEQFETLQIGELLLATMYPCHISMQVEDGTKFILNSTTEVELR